MEERKQVKILHQVWIQGASELPEEYKENRAKWRAALPQEWEMRLWDEESARARWPEYAEVSHLCSHHAMRADIILARCLRDIGGLQTGTDVVPNNIPPLLRFLEATDTMVVVNPKCRSASNGLMWMEQPLHPFMQCICRHQLRSRELLGDRNVWKVTGPGAYWTAIARYMWNLTMVTDHKAYTASYGRKGVSNPEAWVDAGYAGSWHK